MIHKHPFQQVWCFRCESLDFNLYRCITCGSRDLRVYCENCDITSNICIHSAEGYAIKILSRFLLRRILKHKLILYSQYLLEQYLNPDSPYVKYILDNITKKTSGLAYIKESGDMIILSKCK